MLQMSKHYEPELKHKMVRLHLENGRTLKSFADNGDGSAFEVGEKIWLEPLYEIADLCRVTIAADESGLHRMKRRQYSRIPALHPLRLHEK